MELSELRRWNIHDQDVVVGEFHGQIQDLATLRLIDVIQDVRAPLDLRTG